MRSEKAISLVACFIASTFGSGYSPIAPGTVGALIAIIILRFLPPIPLPIMMIITVVFLILGVWAGALAEKAWQKKDDGRINWDEVVGMMISVIYLPKTFAVYMAAFFIFRIFDIIKPFPANVSQKVKGGWGVMLDDVIAGLYTNIIMQIFLRIFIDDLTSA